MIIVTYNIVSQEREYLHSCLNGSLLGLRIQNNYGNHIHMCDVKNTVRWRNYGKSTVTWCKASIAAQFTAERITLNGSKLDTKLKAYENITAHRIRRRQIRKCV